MGRTTRLGQETAPAKLVQTLLFLLRHRCQGKGSEQSSGSQLSLNKLYSLRIMLAAPKVL